jgi:hypothetical protein
VSRPWKVGDRVGMQNPSDGPFVEVQVSEIWTWRDGSKWVRLGSHETREPQAFWEAHGWHLMEDAKP